MGATKSTDSSTLVLGGTSSVRGTLTGAPNLSPENHVSVYSVVQVQVPMFSRRQVFVKLTPGPISVSSGMVTSMGNPGEAWLHTEVGVTFGPSGWVGGGAGVSVAGGTGVAPGCVGIGLHWDVSAIAWVRLASTVS